MKEVIGFDSNFLETRTLITHIEIVFVSVCLSRSEMVKEKERMPLGRILEILRRLIRFNNNK